MERTKRTGKATTATELAGSFGLTSHAVRAWFRRPDWKFSRRGPWDIAAVRRWRATNVEPQEGGRPAKKPAPAPRLTPVDDRDSLIAEMFGEVLRLHTVLARVLESMQTRPGCWCDGDGKRHSDDCSFARGVLAEVRALVREPADETESENRD